MKKKLIAVLLAAAMLTSLCSCGNSDSGSENGGTQAQEAEGTDADASGGKEPVTFTIAVDLHPLTKDENFNNKEAFKMAEEATGVHIEWMPIATSDAEDKVNIMLASDLPDAFLGTLLSESKISTNIDSFVNLAENDMLQTYAPHVVADYETISGGLDLVTWPDGSIRSLITGKQTSYENDAEGIMFMRKDWLDQLGLDVPTTTEEFYDVLCAFRDNDMNGNGDTTDEIPFLPSQSDWCSQIMNVANPWGIAGTDSSDSSAYLMVKDGQVTGTVNTEEFRDFLEYCNTLVQEGLMDKEIFSQTSEQYHAKINEGIVGCYYTWSPYADMSEAEAANWVVENGVIRGVEKDGELCFDPDASIPREQLCVMIANAAHELCGRSVEGASRAKLEAMPDAQSVPEWAADSIAWCLNEGVVNGVDESGTRYVEPASIVDRATMAQIMVNAIDAEALSR